MARRKSRVRKMIRNGWLGAKVIFRYIMAECHAESGQMMNQKSFWLLLKLYINVIDNVIKTTFRYKVYLTPPVLRNALQMMASQYVYDLMFR